MLPRTSIHSLGIADSLFRVLAGEFGEQNNRYTGSTPVYLTKRAKKHGLTSRRAKSYLPVRWRHELPEGGSYRYQIWSLSLRRKIGMRKRKKTECYSGWTDVKILWESEVISVGGKPINLKIVDGDPYAPYLSISRSLGGGFFGCTEMDLRQLGDIKLVLKAAETALTELTERYIATLPKHAFYQKCLLCFTELGGSEFEYDNCNTCFDCSQTIIGPLNDRWMALQHGCKDKNELVSKFESDNLFRADFINFRNQILRLRGTPPQ